MNQYSVKMLKFLTKAQKLGEMMLLEMSQDFPLSCQLNLDGTGEFKFYVAPFLSSGENEEEKDDEEN